MPRRAPARRLSGTWPACRGRGAATWRPSASPRCDELPREVRRVERDEVLDVLADAEELDRDVDGLVHRDDDPAARRAVELRDDKAAHRYGRGERSRLRERVLPDRAVEDEQRLVRRSGQA